MKKVKLLSLFSLLVLFTMSLTLNAQAESFACQKKLYETSGGKYCCKDTSTKKCEAADCGSLGGGPIIQ